MTIVITVAHKRRAYTVARTEWELLKTRSAEKKETHVHVKLESSGRLSTVFYSEQNDNHIVLSVAVVRPKYRLEPTWIKMRFRTAPVENTKFRADKVTHSRDVIPSYRRQHEDDKDSIETTYQTSHTHARVGRVKANRLPDAQFPVEEKRARWMCSFSKPLVNRGNWAALLGTLRNIHNSNWTCLYETQTFTTTCKKSNKWTLSRASSIQSTTSQHAPQDSFLYYCLLCTWVATAQSVWAAKSGVRFPVGTGGPDRLLDPPSFHPMARAQSWPLDLNAG
jgi:hypothetical protein